MEDELKNLRAELEEQLRELDILIKQNNKNLAKFKNLPECGVKSSTVRGCNQYYLIDKDTGKRKYAGKEKHKLVKNLIQRDYGLAADKKLLDLRKRLEKFISSYDVRELEALYENLPLARRSLVSPIIEPKDIFIQKWLEENPGNRNPYPEQGKYRTNRGEMVRSKSEKIIADALDKYNVPYQYEPMLEVGYSTFYPDFVALNIRTRQTKYWEHLGIVSDMEYATKNFSKIQSYEKNGYMIGRDLIITMESVDVSIDVKLVEEKIKEFFL